ncbi:hypothetical protein [Nocardia sp. NBC_01009]|uniref:hypothetical protein n=1 Tax=Nocardia sp. NBC_01009 TaxID=2975996 RepID=UPI0038693FA2|nr:hypothetical protein OHA42_25450 [Nocardia sp. NBC_01009]
MPYYATVPDSMRERLAELAALLHRCRDTYLRIDEDHHWMVHPSSAAASDLAVFAGTVGVRDDRLVVEAVATYLELAAAHCGGLAGLYDAGEIVASPWPLARSLLESCARAIWILGSDPSAEPAVNRLARAYIDNDLSAEYEKEISEYLQGRQWPAYLAAKERFTRLRAEISTVFPETTGRDFNKRTIHGQVCLGPTDTVLWFFALLAKSAHRPLDPRAPKAVYDLLSTHTHPTLDPVGRRRLFAEWDDGGRRAQTIRLDGIEWLTSLAAMGIYDALSSVYQYCGWEFDIDSEFETMIDRTLPGFLWPSP